MSIRYIEVQYIGDTLYLPPYMEREIKHIIVRNSEKWEHFEPERTCNRLQKYGSIPKCSNCGYYLGYEMYYCPCCGAKVINE